MANVLYAHGEIPERALLEATIGLVAQRLEPARLARF